MFKNIHANTISAKNIYISLTKEEYDILSYEDKRKDCIYWITDAYDDEETTTFKRTNCPNCNAPISQHICPYCGTYNE